MKFAMHDNRLEKSLGSDNEDSWTVAAFFFHDRGSEIQKSLLGMFQQILTSILEQVPALIPFVIPFYIPLVKVQKTRKPTWSLDALQSAILAVVHQRKVPVKLLLFLDALDEHQGDNDKLALLLKMLTHSADNNYVLLKLCLASRSWTVFEQHFGRCPGFAIHDYTQQDIRTYIQARLDTHTETLSLGTEASLRRIVDLVTEKASGVFIWVRLVMDVLSKGIRDGTPYATLETQVNSIPQELRDLYADTLRRVEPEYATEAYIMLQKALCSVIPLPINTFMANIDLNIAFIDEKIIPPDIPFKVDDTPLALHKSQLASRCGGLLELAPAATEDGIQRATDPDNSKSSLVVQFIHQTVKEYIESSPRGHGLSSVTSKTLNEDGNMFLLFSCLSQDPCLRCVKKDIFSYAKRAMCSNKATEGATTSMADTSVVVRLVEEAFASKGPSDLDWFLSQRSGQFFQGLRELTEKRPRETALSKLAIAMDFPEFIHETHCDLIPGLLHVAAAGVHSKADSGVIDHGRSIRHLIAKGCKVNEKDHWIIEQIHTLEHYRQWTTTTALEIALLDKDMDEEERVAKVRILLESGANQNSNIWLRGYNGEINTSLLYLCIREHNVTIVRLLLQYGALDITKDRGWELHRSASIRGDKAITQALNDFGVSRKMPLEAAARRPVPALTPLPGLALATPFGPSALDIFRIYTDGRMRRTPNFNVVLRDSDTSEARNDAIFSARSSTESNATLSLNSIHRSEQLSE